MGTIEILQPAMELEPTEINPENVQERKRRSGRSATTDICAPEFIRVFISTESGFSVHGLLRSVSRGGIQVFSPVPIPTRSPLEITIAGCLPIAGEALYCTKRMPVYRVGIALSLRNRPTLPVGAVASVRCLVPPYTAGRGSVLEMRGTSASIFTKTGMLPGSWVRVESGGWVLFGVVKDMVPTSMIGRYLEIHLEAALPVDPGTRASSTETVGNRLHVGPAAIEAGQAGVQGILP